MLFELPAGIDVTAVWDRSSSGFARCFTEICQGRSSNGAMRSQWDVSPASRPLAYSGDSGLVIATTENAAKIKADPTLAQFENLRILEAGKVAQGLQTLEPFSVTAA